MDSAYGREYAKLYQQHWWWRAREKIVLRDIESLRLPPHARILDFGCGDGLFLPALAKYGYVQGLEADATLVSDENPYRDRIDIRLLADSPLRHETFDLITALDVLEHIEQDQQILIDLLSMLKPNGRLLITVPAFMLLWDRHDEINHHCRRYKKSTFLTLLPRHASVRKVRYLFHGLFALKLMVAVLNRRRQRPFAQHKLPPAWVNAMMLRGLLLEDRLLNWARLPFGTSLLVALEMDAAKLHSEADSD
jgi:2-polyprenyl-3-methyl-5-hydroxy-6-metoxy-1,4-benzoquinol methylase